jgi:hypothetical protein
MPRRVGRLPSLANAAAPVGEIIAGAAFAPSPAGTRPNR